MNAAIRFGDQIGPRRSRPQQGSGRRSAGRCEFRLRRRARSAAHAGWARARSFAALALQHGPARPLVVESRRRPRAVAAVREGGAQCPAARRARPLAAASPSGVMRSRRCADHTWRAAAILARAPFAISSRRIAVARSGSVGVPGSSIPTGDPTFIAAPREAITRCVKSRRAQAPDPSQTGDSSKRSRPSRSRSSRLWVRLRNRSIVVLAGAGHDSMVRLWDLATGQLAAAGRPRRCGAGVWRGAAARRAGPTCQWQLWRHGAVVRIWPRVSPHGRRYSRPIRMPILRVLARSSQGMARVRSRAGCCLTLGF